MLTYTVRPLSDRSWLRPSAKRTRSQFTASWSSTLDLLDREYMMLRGRHLVLEIDVEERMIRNDGGIRADARPATPAVVVAFESKHGPLLYRSDLYGDVSWGARNMPVWQANVRAVAMTLEALRAVDRYGASSSGEQYRGYKALPPGTGLVPTGMTVGMALDVLARELCVHPDELAGSSPPMMGLWAKKARGATHPDRNDGDRSRWDAVESAIEVLARAGRLVLS